MSDPMTPAVPDPTVEAREVLAAHQWHHAAAPDPLRDRLRALCDAAMRNKWHLGAEAASVTVAQVLAVLEETK